MNTFSTSKVCILLLSVAVMFGGCSSERNDDNAFVMGLEPGFPPMTFRDADGEIVGYDVDMAKEVAKRINYTLQIKPITWDNKEDELYTGNIDCIWGALSITEERAKIMLFTPPYLENSQVMVFMRDRGFRTKNDLNGKKIGVQADSPGQYVVEADKTFIETGTQLIKYHDAPTAFQELAQGDIDAIVIDVVIANYMARKSDAELEIPNYPLAEDLYGIGFRLEDRALRDKIWAALKTMEADGTVAKISEKWFGTNLSIIDKN